MGPLAAQRRGLAGVPASLRGTTLQENAQALRDDRPSPGHCGAELKGAKATVLRS